jgi:hypothetical protein
VLHALIVLPNRSRYTAWIGSSCSEEEAALNGKQQEFLIFEPEPATKEPPMTSCAKSNLNQMQLERATVAPSAIKLRKGTPQIVLPVKETNLDAVRSFMFDCLVPILAQEFLRRRDYPKQSQTEPISRNRTTTPFGKEDGR